MDVIHGTGRPRIVADDIVTFTDTVVSTTSTEIVLTTGTTEANVVNKLIRSSNSSGLTACKGVSYDVGTKTITVTNCEGGLPDIGSTVEGVGEAIDLPYCQTLTERFTNDYIQKKLYNGNIVSLKRGFYYSATLDYSRALTKEDLEALQPLFSNNQGNIIFYPRRDNTGLSYLVEFPEGYAIEFAQRNFHNKHKFVIIEFIGVRRLTEVPFQFDPGSIGYGLKYADGMYA